MPKQEYYVLQSCFFSGIVSVESVHFPSFDGMSRKGHPRMQEIREVIYAKLKDIVFKTGSWHIYIYI